MSRKLIVPAFFLASPVSLILAGAVCVAGVPAGAALAISFIGCPLIAVRLLSR